MRRGLVRRLQPSPAMDAITLLESQHEEVELLFGKFDKARSPYAKQALFNVIADSLAAHAAIEERLFYPAVYVGNHTDDLRSVVEEHLAMKRLIADLLALTTSDPKFDPLMKLLQDQIDRHVDREASLFASTRKLLPKRELEALGDAMSGMFDRLMEGAPRHGVPAELGPAVQLS
ncbi:MAG: hemerythrin [Myxococcaceae bacterium]|nr:hemerythrin [Myxococcaceae bacterium]